MQSDKVQDVTDQELVELAGNGNISAYGCLYDRYINQIYRYVYFRLTSQMESEDLTEMVFLKTFEVIRQDRTKIDNFKAWIYRTAHNLIIDHYRLRKNLVPLEEAVRLHDPKPSPEMEILNGEEHIALQRVIAKLEGVSQQVITCRFINGLSYEETAQIMRMKPGNVRVIQFRALQKLRELLKKEEVAL
jgi:RNA polymerase sigma-70 factor, ECF subfamily